MLKNKIFLPFIAMLCLTLSAAPLLAQEQESEKPDPEEMAIKEAERLESLLKLEYWQVFYVDSILRYNYTKWMEEIESLQKARVENSDLYVAIQDKWMERNENALQKVFTEAQWKEYLKSGAEKYIKDREKRRAKAAGVLDEKKSKKKKK